MCSESRALSGWPRKASRWLALIAAVTLALRALAASLGQPARGDELPAPPAANSPDEPMATAPSLARSAAFLDAVALDWTRRRRCGTCHTNYAYLIARPALDAKATTPSVAQVEIRTFFENRVAHWDDAEPKSSKPRWDAEVVATAASLALNDAATTGRLHPRTRQALNRIWTLQKPDGSWTWLKCAWPPLEYDDYYGAVFAAVGVGAAPDDYARGASAHDGVERLRRYLAWTPAPNLHHKTFLLWASTRLDGLMTDRQRDQTIAALRKIQRADGGWSLPSLGDWNRRDGSPNGPEAPSDGYATGLVAYVLRRAGVPADDPALVRAADWLMGHQRASGRWFTRSLNNDKAHYIANAGTGFAVMALKEIRPQMTRIDADEDKKEEK